MAVSIPLVTAGIGAASSLGGLFGGSNMPQAPQSYQPQYQATADTGAISGIQSLPQYNIYGAMTPQVGQLTSQLNKNPYAGQFQQGSNIAAGQGWNTGQQFLGAGGNLMNAGQGMLPYAQSILQTGFDPQQALYQQQYQLQQDQDRAGQSARGLAMSPYGAGVENKANTDFNIAWQNAQLGRQNQALQGAGYGLNSAGNAINLGQNVSTLGLNTLNQAAAQPYNTYQGIGQQQISNLGQYGQFGQNAANQANQQIADYLQYLGVGNQAAGIQNQAYANQITAQNNQFNQSQKLGSNLGSSLSGLGNWYGKSGFGGGSNPYYGPLNG